MPVDDALLQEVRAALDELQREQQAAAQKTQAALDTIKRLLTQLDAAKGMQTQKSGPPIPS